jgi:hypothetical protein
MIVDYRIAASIINCFYNRLTNDNEDDLHMARKIKELLNTPNMLQKLIQQKNLTRMTKFTDLEASQDIGFPRLTERDIELNITLGDYQIDQARGYIREHFDQNGDMKLSVAKEEPKTSTCVVCCRFHSRHRNQITYKVYVQLDSAQLGHNSISGWFCDCSAGARTVGCCSHIAAVIVYFCLDKFSPTPKYLKLSSAIKDTRSTREPSTQSSIKRDLSFYSQNQNTSQQKKNSINSLEPSQFSVPSSSTFPQLPTPSPSCFTLQSPTPTPSFQTRSKKSAVVELFKKNVPEWGGKCVLPQFHANHTVYKRVELSNTCSIDYLLLAVWLSKVLNPRILTLISQFETNFQSLTSSLFLTIDYADCSKWDEAKSIWMVDVVKKAPNDRRIIDCFGSEYLMFGEHVRCMQKSNLVCINGACPYANQSQDFRLEYFIERDLNSNICCSLLNNKCRNCDQTLEIRFEYNPPWILVESSVNSAVNFTELPLELDINGRKFKLLCSTIESKSTKAHFEAIFTLENRFFLVDDLKKGDERAVEYLPLNSITSFSFYMCFE